jgi:transcription elongation factor GreA
VDGRRRTPEVGVRYTMTITWMEALRIASSVAVRDGFVNYATQITRPGHRPFSHAGNLDRVSETHLTQSTYERLRAELEDLTTRGRVEVARRIEAARALGDLSENGDYHAAKDDQGKMEARIRQLEATLRSAVLVDQAAAVTSSTVGAGTVVSLRYEGDDDVERYLIGSIEERHDELSVITPDSPLGQALLGRSAGETVQYEAPSGTLKVEIVKVGG